MRSIRLCAVYWGSSLTPLSGNPVVRSPPACPAEYRHGAPLQSPTPGFFTGAKYAATLHAMKYSSRWYATATTTGTAASRLSTAAEATAELQHWISFISCNSPSSCSSAAVAAADPRVLSGKSLVLCVAALQLHEAQRKAESANRSSEDKPALVQQYLAALAYHVYTQCNANGKPHAAWLLFDDVKKNVICAEALHTSLHYLQHHAFQSAPLHGGKRQEVCGTAQANAETEAPADYEGKCAARDVELTFEAVEVLLVGHAISEIHRAAAASEKVVSPSTTAAIVPHAEAAAFYIGNLASLIQSPLHGCEALQTATAFPTSFLFLSPAKQQYWKHTAQQLTTELYLALLVTNTHTADAQLVSQAFRAAVRAAYGIPVGRFGLMRSMHYVLTIALPYVARSISTIWGVLRAQQAQTAKEAIAAAKSKMPPPSRHKQKQWASKEAFLARASMATASMSAKRDSGREGSESGAPGSGGRRMSSDRMNKITLAVVCVAAVVYMTSSKTELSPAGNVKPGADKEPLQSSALHQTYQRLCATAVSTTALQKVQSVDLGLHPDVLHKK
ncbi:hypothetical protein ABL78_5901 [Leptomonas seymouri]|uniref:Uncharacterized protein n=1 Tax=Leptomonas seymouri TaxID=5684 RepID=A0A0N0P496_LEPSE|nr:hypothetical protein ABL78_5901 [Leptomonas seymouri]|eukprot:KPI85039.1 hypothetical protein ABL78_5901 [Leptomonas seymouri]